MMVIQGTIGTDTNRIYPADRCFWSQTSNTTANGISTGYSIDTAFFLPGASVAIGGQGAATIHEITNPRLGYIGKSGRFVEMAG